MFELLCKIVLVFVIIDSTQAGNYCPSPEITYPCQCTSGTYSGIACVDAPITSLKAVFKRINAELTGDEKKFYSFYSYNTGIKEFEDDMFSGLSFERMNIDNEWQLSKIHVNAFKSATYNLKEIYFWGDSNVSDFGGDYQPYKAFGSLPNLERLFFSLNGPQNIPDNAFTTSNVIQSKMWQIYLIQSGNNQVSSIGNYAFYYMTGLTNIEFYTYNIEHISAHAFDFAQPSSKRLSIQLDNNKLSASSFEPEFLLNAKRPVSISLQYNNIEYLDENAFLSFLLNNVNNTVYIDNNPVVCDCRMFWLFLRKSILEKQVPDFKCTDGNYFWSKGPYQFLHCYGS